MIQSRCSEIPSRRHYSEAEMVMFPRDRQIMNEKYLAFLKALFTLHKSELHHSIVRAVEEELDKSGRGY